MPFLVGDPYKPSLGTVTGRGSIRTCEPHVVFMKKHWSRLTVNNLRDEIGLVTRNPELLGHFGKKKQYWNLSQQLKLLPTRLMVSAKLVASYRCVRKAFGPHKIDLYNMSTFSRKIKTTKCFRIPTFEGHTHTHTHTPRPSKGCQLNPKGRMCKWHPLGIICHPNWKVQTVPQSTSFCYTQLCLYTRRCI